MTKAHDRALELFELLVDNPDGVTKPEIDAHLGCSAKAGRSAIRALRNELSDGDTINVITNPTPRGDGPYVYTLVGSFTDEARAWFGASSKQIDTRLDLMLWVSQSLAKATDGRTVEGRKARIRVKAFARLIEDLADAEPQQRMPID